MKTLFIPVSINFSANSSKLEKVLEVLPKNLAVVYSVQYKDFAESLKEKLSKSHNLLGFSQVLGCSNPHFSEKVNCILVIADGRFHAISLAYETQKQVYLFERDRLVKILPEEIAFLEKKRKAAYLNFLNSEKVGVLISTKPGQQRLAKSLSLKKKFKNKRLYFFLSNEINFNETENFGLDFWVNTACPRMDFDNSNIININRISKN
jgi:diphthamide biosynthesis enzyme Dph1/Dph2-like protein